MMKLNIDPRPRIRFMDINSHRLVSTNFMGNYASVFKGRGAIFESYREYSPALDDASAIDWKASMRGSKIVVREFVEERNLDVFFLVDVSHTMVFGSQKKLKHEYAAEMVASMTFAILDRGDSVGLGMFSDTVRGVLLPDRGMGQYRRIITELANPAHYDHDCDFNAAVKFCLQRLKPQTLLILITDGMSLNGDWERLLRVANRKFEVLVLLVRDPRDDMLPEGVGIVTLEDPVTGEQVLVDADRIRADYAKAAKEMKEKSIAIMRRGRIADIPIFSTSQDFTREVIKFFERRKRRLR